MAGHATNEGAMMWHWLRTVDEEAIGVWANKGLLRRGAKVLAGSAPVQWTLLPAEARASIEGHTQRVEGVGFARLSCDCPALGPCHHLCAFLLGLRQHLLEQPGQAPDSGDAGLATGGDDARSVLPAPWLAEDFSVLERALGAAHVRRALHWRARGIEVALETCDGVLIGQFSEPEEVTVRIPSAGGLAASTCGCKAAQCAHRARVVLQAREAAGAPLPETPVQALEPVALARLAQLDDWLQALVLQGSTGLGGAFIDQGDALATELRQAGLPRLGNSLQALLALLRDEQARRGGAAERLPGVLAAVWMLARGLRQTPLPRPYAEMAGEHRRTYHRLEGVSLLGVAAEVWDTLSGHRGFSVHFLAPGLGRYFSWSESRARDLDAQWMAEDALREGQLAGVATDVLLTRPLCLLNGWASRDGRLSAREGSRLVPLEEGEGEATAWPEADDLGALVRTLGEALLADPWQQSPPRLARLAVGKVGAVRVDQALRRWSVRASDPSGRDFILRGGMEGFEARGMRKLLHRLEAGRVLQEVFGRIACEGGHIVCAPLSVRWQGVAGIQHLNAPWLRTAQGGGAQHA